MARHPFGWDLPPGCTMAHIEAQFGDEGPCQCCGHDPADCICPECGACHETGNPRCYKEHAMSYNREQLMGQARMRIHEYKEKIQDEELFLAYMEEHPDESPD